MQRSAIELRARLSLRFLNFIKKFNFNSSDFKIDFSEKKV
jgi:hypothetical protein